MTVSRIKCCVQVYHGVTVILLRCEIPYQKLNKFKCAYWCLNSIQYKVRFLLGMLGAVTRSDSEGLKT